MLSIFNKCSECFCVCADQTRTEYKMIRNEEIYIRMDEMREKWTDPGSSQKDQQQQKKNGRNKSSFVATAQHIHETNRRDAWKDMRQRCLVPLPYMCEWNALWII